MSGVDDLFRRYVAEYRAAGDVDPRPFLAKLVGVDRAELAARIDRFLEQAPPPAYDPEAFARFRTDPAREALVASVLDDATLAELRAEAGLTKAEVGKTLAQRLGLSGRESAVKSRYHDIEVGNIDPERVRGSVWQALGDMFGAAADRLRGAAERTFGGQPQPATYLFMRSARLQSPPPAASPGTTESADDEVDRALFED